MTADQLNSGGRGLNMPSPFLWTAGPCYKNDDLELLYKFFLHCSPVVAISVGLATMAGFALSKYRFRGQLLIFAIFIGGNFVPFQILMVPVLRLTQTWDL